MLETSYLLKKPTGPLNSYISANIRPTIASNLRQKILHYRKPLKRFSQHMVGFCTYVQLVYTVCVKSLVNVYPVVWSPEVS